MYELSWKESSHLLSNCVVGAPYRFFHRDNCHKENLTHTRTPYHTRIDKASN